MAYFEDGSPYRFLSSNKFNDIPPNMRSVGWLDVDVPFATGRIDPRLVEHLFWLALNERRGITLGYHRCPFDGCTEASSNGPPSYSSPGGQSGFLGSAEVWVGAPGGWIAPNLIAHYVANHNYVPPAEFLDDLAADMGRNMRTLKCWSWVNRRRQNWRRRRTAARSARRS